jgi:hypothetical protein
MVLLCSNVQTAFQIFDLSLFIYLLVPGSDCSDDRQIDCDNDKTRVAKFWVGSGTIFADQVSATN